MLEQLLVDGFVLVIVISGAPLAACAVTGLFVSIVQTATQIQEQNISHLLKIGTFTTVVIIAGEWFGDELIRYTARTLSSLVSLGCVDGA